MCVFTVSVECMGNSLHVITAGTFDSPPGPFVATYHAYSIISGRTNVSQGCGQI